MISLDLVKLPEVFNPAKLQLQCKELSKIIHIIRYLLSKQCEIQYIKHDNHISIHMRDVDTVLILNIYMLGSFFNNTTIIAEELDINSCNVISARIHDSKLFEFITCIYDGNKIILPIL